MVLEVVEADVKGELLLLYECDGVQDVLRQLRVQHQDLLVLCELRVVEQRVEAERGGYEVYVRRVGRRTLELHAVEEHQTQLSELLLRLFQKLADFPLFEHVLV